MTPLKGSHIQWAHCAISGKMHTTSNSVTGLLMTEIRATPNETTTNTQRRIRGENRVVSTGSCEIQLSLKTILVRNLFTSKDRLKTLQKNRPCWWSVFICFHPISVTSIETATTKNSSYKNSSSPNKFHDFRLLGVLTFCIWNHLKSTTVANNSLSFRYFLLFFIQLLRSVAASRFPKFQPTKGNGCISKLGFKKSKDFLQNHMGASIFWDPPKLDLKKSLWRLSSSCPLYMGYVWEDRLTGHEND